MTDGEAIERFEQKLSDRVRAYTGVATGKPFDALAVARAAMSPKRGLVSRRSGWGRPGRWLALIAGVAALVAVAALFALPGSRPAPTDSVGVPVPADLRHEWLRPSAIGPGGDPWGSGFLTVADGSIGYGREPGAGATTSTIAATGPASLEVTATASTKDCEPEDAGAYGWSLAGNDTVLTLTPITADDCTARQTALAGQWVRHFPPEPILGDALPAGSHTTSTFDPLGNPGTPTHLEFTVPEGWRLMGDDVGSFVVQHVPDDPASDPFAEPMLAVFSNPRLEADFVPGQGCAPTGDAPGVGGGLEELVAAIVSRPGVVSTPPAEVTVAGHPGRLLDLRLSPAWTGGCSDLSGPVIGMPILHQGGSTRGPVFGLGPREAARLILLDIGGDRTLAIVIPAPAEKQSSDFEHRLAAAMPIIESFQFVPASP